MTKILQVRSVNDYAQYIGAPVLHPLVSVIHYDELTSMRHSLNSYDVYAMFLNDGVLPELTYGTVHYHMPQHTLMCVAPGQVGGKADTGEIIKASGWALLFDPRLLHDTFLGKQMSRHRHCLHSPLCHPSRKRAVARRQQCVKRGLRPGLPVAIALLAPLQTGLRHPAIGV